MFVIATSKKASDFHKTVHTMNTTFFSAAVLFLVFMVIALFTFKNQNYMSQDKPVKELLKDNPGKVIDVRTLREYNAGHLVITDAHFDLLNGDFQKAVPTLDKDETYYLYCRTGNRSGQAARMMKEAGFENVHNIGGYQELLREGLEGKTPDDKDES